MVLRVSQLNAKAATTVVGSLRVAQVTGKAAITASGDLRVSQITAKAIVRTYKISRIKKAVPPVPLTYICGCNPVCCFTYG